MKLLIFTVELHIVTIVTVTAESSKGLSHKAVTSTGLDGTLDHHDGFALRA